MGHPVPTAWVGCLKGGALPANAEDIKALLEEGGCLCRGITWAGEVTAGQVTPPTRRVQKDRGRASQVDGPAGKQVGPCAQRSLTIKMTCAC